ncbi:hypothetical protein D3C80_946780 [compost metagenome]
MGHGVRLLAQLEQGAGDAAGDVEEGQVTDLAGGLAQAIGHLAAEGVEDFRVLLGQLAELGVADLGHFAFGLGAHPSAALLLVAFAVEQAHLAKEIAGVEVGDDHLAAIVVLDEDGHRTLDDEEQGFAAITGIDDGALGGVATAVTMREQLVEVLDLWCEADSNHARSLKVKEISPIVQAVSCPYFLSCLLLAGQCASNAASA